MKRSQWDKQVKRALWANCVIRGEMPLMLVCFPGQLTNNCCDKHDDLIINLTDYLFARLLVRVNVAACVRMSADLASVLRRLNCLIRPLAFGVCLQSHALNSVLNRFSLERDAD